MTYRCACCGYASPTEAFFRKEQVGAWGRRRPVCAGCKPEIYGASMRRSIVLISFYGVVSLALSTAFPGQGAFWLTLALLLAWWPIVACVHEAGHAAAGMLAGFRVTAVTVGAGPPLIKASLGRTLLQLNVDIFAGGLTRIRHPRPNPPRWRQALLYLGGAMANVLACLLVFAALDYVTQPGSTTPSVIVLVLFAFGLGNALGLLNLLPFRTKRTGHASDGKLLLGLFRARTPGESWHLAYAEIIELLSNGRDNEVLSKTWEACVEHPKVPELLSLLIDRIGRAEGPAAAWRAYQERKDAIVSDPPNERAAAWVRLCAAWEAIKTEDPTLLPLAEALVQDDFPDADNPAFRGTQGALHVARGRFSEAAELLRPAVRDMGNPKDKADFCLFLARAERQLGTAHLETDFLKLREHLLAVA